MKDGAIDEIRVFNRALTPLEVQLPRTNERPLRTAAVPAAALADDARRPTMPRVVAGCAAR